MPATNKALRLRARAARHCIVTVCSWLPELLNLAKKVVDKARRDGGCVLA